MDLSAIVVILVLTALAIGAIIWMEIHSRRAQSDDASNDGGGVDASVERR